MANIIRRMTVVAKPEKPKTWLTKRKGDTPTYFHDKGNIDYVCGKCGTVMAKGMLPNQVQGTFICLCVACDSYNEIDMPMVNDPS
jgi:hypothetical protein